MPDKYEEYSREELIRLLRERDRKPKFGLVWERDEIEHDRSLNDDFVVLEPDAALSVGEAPHQNLVIEGDNFDALRYLRMTHAGKVKCIYIDPPYNTGNRDFIYNDRFVDKDDAYKHSKWLEYMYRRLTLAKDLLAEDGVIFVSIDDGEACPLKLMMDNVFGADLFIGQFIWKSRQNKDNRTKNGASIDHEYVLTYGHCLRGVERDHEQFKNLDNDPRGPWTSGNMVGLADEKSRPNLHYDLIDPATGLNYGKPRQGWRFDRSRMASLIAEGRILWPKNSKGRPRLKVFLSEMKSEFTGFSSIVGNEVFTYHGTRELEDIFEEVPFNFPKPSDLILELIRQGAPGKDDIVVDFFAGSGTTAHAVMKLNAEDGGNRRFILVSSTEATSAEPDKNICRDVCAERLRRVIRGYENKKGERVEGLGGSFAYLRTRRIPAGRVFNAIQHGQVWQALQLIHGQGLTDYDAAALAQVAGTEEARLVYVPKVNPAAVAEVARLAALGGTLRVYSWQPGALRQRVEASNASFEKIPEFLVKRFGGGK
ncbi:MAG: site-specific DNA-methyltransferase [Sulfuricellaceae bacterium]|jgi:adenine-specific DNA-methyltransferase